MLYLEVDSRAVSVHRWDEGVEGNTPYVRASDSGVGPKVGKLGGGLVGSSADSAYSP